MNSVVTGVIATIAISAALFTFGYSQGKKSMLEEYQNAVKARDKLQTRLNEKDVALLEAQQERNELRDKEVVKYDTVYRDRIKDPVVAQCVRDSGILQLYDSTVSTPVK